MLQLFYKKMEPLAPFSPLRYTANATMNCAISPKLIRVAEELAKGTVEALLNGCEGDGGNGGRGLQSAYVPREGVRLVGAVRFIIMRRKQRKILKGGNRP